MEFIGVLIGAGIVAASPLVPGLRPVAKAAVKGGLAVVDMSKGAASAAAHQWSQVVSEANDEAKSWEDDTEAVAGPDGANDGVAIVEVTAAAEPVEPAAASGGAEDAAAAMVAGEPVADDLTQIAESTKTAAWLHEQGITTFEELAASDPQQMKEQLMGLGRAYRAVEPQAWVEEAASRAAERG